MRDACPTDGHLVHRMEITPSAAPSCIPHLEKGIGQNAKHNLGKRDEQP